MYMCKAHSQCDATNNWMFLKARLALLNSSILQFTSISSIFQYLCVSVCKYVSVLVYVYMCVCLCFCFCVCERVCMCCVWRLEVFLCTLTRSRSTAFIIVPWKTPLLYSDASAVLLAPGRALCYFVLHYVTLYSS